MKYKEIKAKDLKPKKFIDEKVREIREMVGDGIAISALSGGVDSSVVTNRRVWNSPAARSHLDQETLMITHWN